MAYIYKIENQINHKIYIGKTEKINPLDRWKEHIKESQRARSSNRALYRAINKYGVENFTFSILEETNNPNQREQDYIIQYNSYHFGYNETIGGDGASYLQLPEEEICKYFLANSKNLKQTAIKFGYDKESIKKVLYKNNINVNNNGETTKLIVSKSVAKIDKDTQEILQIYPSIIEAERQNPQCNKHINAVCKGKRKTAGGYAWNYADNL